jgi:hypothetical protein
MIDFFVAWMQALCIVGLMCGAYYAITYGGEDAAVETRAPDYDAVTTHAWDRGEEPVLHV